MPEQPDHPKPFTNAGVAPSAGRATAGASGRATLTVIPTPDAPSMGTAASIQVIERKLSEAPDDIVATSRDFAKALKEQADELRASKPNEPGPLAQYENLIAFLDKMAAGLGELADALERAFKTATGEPRPLPEPVFLGKAAVIARRLQLGTVEWIEENRNTVFSIPFKTAVLRGGLAFLHLLGLDSAPAIMALGHVVRSGGTKKPPDKTVSKRKKSRGKNALKEPFPSARIPRRPRRSCPRPPFARWRPSTSDYWAARETG